MKAEQFIGLGYQRILTFERPGGGFDWWGNGPPLIWLTAYGVQQLTATSRVREIDKGVIERAYGFLAQQQGKDGSWNVVGSTHGETIAGVENPALALTAYVTWSLAEAGLSGDPLTKALAYLRTHRQEATNSYLLSLMANALAFGAPNEPVTKEVCEALVRARQEQEGTVFWPYRGQTATCAYGNSADIETTGMAIYALVQNKSHVTVVNKALNYLVQQKTPYGTWGSTQATILALKALVMSSVMTTQGGDAIIDIWFNDQKATTWKLHDDNRDVMQLLDLGDKTRIGPNQVKLVVQGNANVMYQVVGRHFLPWPKESEHGQNPIEITVAYDRHKLAKDDTLVATATMRYNGAKPTFMVILDLGIPPGFSADGGDFAELVGENKIARYSMTSRQITIYLAQVKPGEVFTCRYHLKAKYPLRAKTPKSVAYEYYAPEVMAESKPVEIVVAENK